jgi:hypothetical protein
MLSIRVPASLREELKAAAKASGRSLAQECQRRLASSPQPELLEEMAQLLELVVATVGDPQVSAVAFDQMREGFEVLLAAARPTREEVPADPAEQGAGRWAAKVVLSRH